MKKWIGLLGLCAGMAQAEVTLAPAFSDYMVLQRGAVAPVWGTAKPGETSIQRQASPGMGRKP